MSDRKPGSTRVELPPAIPRPTAEHVSVNDTSGRFSALVLVLTFFLVLTCLFVQLESNRMHYDAEMQRLRLAVEQYQAEVR